MISPFAQYWCCALSKWPPKMKKFALALSLFALSTAASAVSVVNAVPTTWKLESYGEKGAVLWFAGSTCVNGQLTLPGTATTTDHNRFYATVMAAKVSASKMFVYYDVVGANCVIVSYGLSE
jgi:hypothetical protein